MASDSARERTHRPPDPPKGTVRREERTPLDELRGSLRRFMRDDRPSVAIPRDVLLVLLVLGVLMAGLWVYTAQPFPTTSPLVVVESGSMMHPDPPYGRVGTIDPGDLVLVKAVDGREDIVTAYGPGDRTGYGGKGDVIVYRPNDRVDATPIIHRAMTWVEVRPGVDSEGDPDLRYDYHDERGELLTDQRSVTMESMGIRNMRPEESGFITKGDNPRTNAVADQVSHIPGRLVEADWVVGKARGEVPWLGLVKLALSGNPVPAEAEGQCRILLAWSPCDTWVMLGVSFGTLVLVPFALEKTYQASPRMRRWFE